MWKKVKFLKLSNFTFFHNVFYAICILKSFNSHISVIVCSFFEFGTVSKWCVREWVKPLWPEYCPSISFLYCHKESSSCRYAAKPTHIHKMNTDGLNSLKYTVIMDDFKPLYRHIMIEAAGNHTTGK